MALLLLVPLATLSGPSRGALLLRGGAGEQQLSQSEMLTFDEALPWLRYVRMHGVKQFITMFRELKDLTSDELLWGDEIEYHLVHFDVDKRTVKVALRAAEVLAELRQKEHQLGRRDGFGEACSWHPEYGAWMVEGTPRVPYGGYTADLRRVEMNMRLRRKRLAAVLKSTEHALTIPAFPLLGVGEFTEPNAKPDNQVTQSSTAPDALITPIPRFHALTRNIRLRRGSKVDIRVPLFADVNTDAAALAEGIKMDAMAYGMGCCCLQVTFQARDIDESRHLYDHLAVLAPVMLALTAATPILHGKLADTDVRWATVAASVDDRTPHERGVAPSDADPAHTPERLAQLAGGGVAALPKSRYESISVYLANCGGCSKSYNDINPPVDQEAMDMLMGAGIDPELAQHVAHLFVRDPLVIMKDRIELDDTETDHFENLQSTNWQTVRWKPPPKAKSCGPIVGWRVEFRSMEVQLSDFENAAFTTFVVLVSRVILAFGLNLYIPLSKVDENMRRAHHRDAFTQEKFWFRKHMAPPQQPVADPDECEEMTILEIMVGKETYFPGLIPLIFAYLEAIQCDPETWQQMQTYMDFIRRRASGQLATAAKWMRRKVATHPSYQHDSVVPSDVAYDIVQACTAIAEGRAREPMVLGKQWIPPLRTDDAYYVPLKHATIQRGQREALLESYAARFLAERQSNDESDAGERS
ncbi:hypothetical protein AB1Y20_010769 [Prymnesium parvum]|uniref:Glutamate--cysteine ligase n=1 Tax=Prymnesium parvum TaxID=97485 RepID=A0AB34IRX7_PRYPA|mmetsp:Transcript_24407/g.60563  ORF Transcript_24407/g.60563 Transcript_24407/m.60563 type:complete len:698 (+) Transcript_24407:22-2115(+)